jgi:anti-sigma B factor antagonist
MEPDKTVEKDLLFTIRHDKGSELKIDIWYEGEVWIFRPFGRIDTATSDDLEENLIQGIEQGMKNIVLDLTDVPYISSAGLRVLIKGAKKIKPTGGDIVLASPSTNVLEILNLSGFKKIFKIYPDQKTSIKSFIYKRI